MDLETFPEIATVVHEAGKKSIFLGDFNALDTVLNRRAAELSRGGERLHDGANFLSSIHTY
jgi:hypothetical protein